MRLAGSAFWVAIVGLSTCADAKRAVTGPAPPPVASAPAPVVVEEEVRGEPEPPPVAAEQPPKPELSTTDLQAWIYEQPSLGSLKLGALRAGARVARSAEPIKGNACGPGLTRWYSVEPAGYVCEGHEGITTDLDDPAVKAGFRFPPRTSEPFPYGYGTSYGSPLYVRVPTAREAQKAEGDVEAHIAAIAATHAKMSPAHRPPPSALPASEPPPFLADHAVGPNFVELHLLPDAVLAGRAWPGMRLSFLSAFEGEGRLWYLTSEGFVVPADRVRAARLCDFHGVELARPGETGEHLPLLWVNWRPAPVWRMSAEGRARPSGLSLAVQAHAEIAAKEVVLGGVHYLELLEPPDGAEREDGVRWLVRAQDAMRLDAQGELPGGVTSDDDWIDVAIARQTLVLYHGLLPVFATLVSTGVDGVDDPDKTRSTPRGLFRILHKHVTARMQADERPPAKEGDEPDPRYRIDDVPYVQYFQAGFALHGAYWHDAFGQPKSHGCINVSPRDAVYLFERTTPKVPGGWHVVWAGRGGAEQGTFLNVRVY
jgi:L,D-transpeptidase-like protein